MKTPFRDSVERQVALLQGGKPLAAFDLFFAPNGKMFANDAPFASSAQEGRRKQEPYINSALSVQGLIADLNIHEGLKICVFQNLTSFEAGDGSKLQIDGLCWQQWQDDQIEEERYYDGAQKQQLIADGILLNPSQLKL